MAAASQPFHLMLKPAGPDCNLACEYCYYRAKAAWFPGRTPRMDHGTLERVTAAYLEAHPGPEVTFGWQGGEPLLMGVEFFRQAVALQRRYARPGQRIANTLQTNGTLLNDEWAAFLAEQGFLVGLSIDGAPHLHDRYRRDAGGQPSYQRAVAGLRALQRHGVEHNALVTVNRGNAARPLEVYQHLLDLGLRHLQFIPVVERRRPGERKVAAYSVRPEALGEFLCSIFDHWARRHVGQVHVQLFECALGAWLGAPPSLCTFAPICGLALVAEHNGDLYPCDHFVEPDLQLGRIEPGGLAALVESPRQRGFGRAKAELSEECRSCQALSLCWGDCPKHRLRSGTDGRPISYLCPAYRRFFAHSAPVLKAMADEVRAGRPAARVMEVLRGEG